MKRIFDPQSWTWKAYLSIGLFLVGINLFGPRGLLHWSLLHQQNERIRSLNQKTQNDIKKLQEEISNFKRYDYQQQRAIREDLGYLLPQEYSLEFVEAPSPKSRETAQ
jgi:hypothetical protein